MKNQYVDFKDTGSPETERQRDEIMKLKGLGFI